MSEQNKDDLQIKVNDDYDKQRASLFINSNGPKLKTSKIDWSYLQSTLSLRRKSMGKVKFLLALTCMVGVLLFLFVIIPRYSKDPEAKDSKSQEHQASVALPIDLVVKDSSARILDKPDLKGRAITSVLLNESLKLLDKNQQNGYYHVEIVTGVQGYIDARQVSSDVSSLSLENAVKKVVVSGERKNIRSEAYNGNLLAYAELGTEFLADYYKNDLVRIKLPNQSYGWLNTRGLTVLSPTEELKAPAGDEAPVTYFVSLAMYFKNSTYIPGGLTQSGIDLPGVVYLSGKLNGLVLPRTLEKLSLVGSEIKFTRNDKGKASFDALKEGDLLFFSADGKPETLDFMGLYLGDERILMEVASSHTIDIVSLKDIPTLADRLATVRRLYD